jgi:hypothetical protein
MAAFLGKRAADFTTEGPVNNVSTGYDADA